MKNKFVVVIGSAFFLPNVKTVSKPSVEVATKEFKLINHTFNYPGLVKWSPITITFVDMAGDPDPAKPIFSTADFLYKMLGNMGYAPPTTNEHEIGYGGKTTITTPEKASTNDNSLGTGISDSLGEQKNTGAVNIYQIDSNGKTIELWTLKNPILKSIKWGELDYSSDDFVEYSIEVAYDWAEMESGGDAPPLNTYYQKWPDSAGSQSPPTNNSQ